MLLSNVELQKFVGLSLPGFKMNVDPHSFETCYCYSDVHCELVFFIILQF